MKRKNLYGLLMRAGVMLEAAALICLIATGVTSRKGKEEKILEINSPKQKSLRSAKEHLRVESFLLSSEVTGEKTETLCNLEE